MPGIEVTRSAGLRHQRVAPARTTTSASRAADRRRRRLVQPAADRPDRHDLTFTAVQLERVPGRSVASPPTTRSTRPRPAHRHDRAHGRQAPTRTTTAGWLADMLVDIADDDTVGITSTSSAALSVDEANVVATDTFTVRLDSRADRDRSPSPSRPTRRPTSRPGRSRSRRRLDGRPDVDGHGRRRRRSTRVARIPARSTFTRRRRSAVRPPPAAIVTANVLDDDIAGVTISPGTLALDETLPASDTYHDPARHSAARPRHVVAARRRAGRDHRHDAHVHARELGDPADGHRRRPSTIRSSRHRRTLAQLTHAFTSADSVYAAITPADKDRRTSRQRRARRHDRRARRRDRHRGRRDRPTTPSCSTASAAARTSS